MASSFSHGDAFISSKPERTTTVTSSPPSRREERQQSMAVLPPPSTMTRLPILVMWPNETLESQSMPIWMFLAASWRPGMSRSRPRGAPEPTKIASQSSATSALRLSMRWPAAELDAEVEDVAALLVDDRLQAGGSAEFACGSCRPPWGRNRTPRSDSRAARGRVRPRARPGRRPRARCAGRSAWRPGGAGAPLMSSLKSAATRLRRQIATGSFSTRPRRHAGSQGRSQVRPNTPGNTFDCQLIM